MLSKTSLASASSDETIAWLNGFFNKVTWQVDKKTVQTYYTKRGSLYERVRYYDHKFKLEGNKLVITWTYYIKDKASPLHPWKVDSWPRKQTYDLKKVTRFFLDVDEAYEDDMFIHPKQYSIRSKELVVDGKYESYIGFVFTQREESESIQRIVKALNHLVKLAGGGKDEPF